MAGESAGSTSLVADSGTIVRLQLAPTARTHRLGDDAAVVADHARLRLEGNIAEFFDSRLRPLLTGELTAAEIVAHFPQLDPDSLRSWLARLVEAGVVVEARQPGDGPASVDDSAAMPAAAFYQALGLDERAFDQLRGLRVGVVGLNRCGRSIARLLADAGVGELVLIDAEDSAAGPPDDPTKIVRRRLTDREALLEALHGCHAVVHAWGDAHLASAHWSNQWALANGTKALFCFVAAHLGRAGPLVLPGESSCFLCARMRAIAADDDYELAMADESWRFQQQLPSVTDRSAFPAVAEMVASVAALEMIKVELGIGTPALVDRIWELDPLTLTSHHRPVLQQPQCPACRKKGLPPPAQPDLEALSGAVEQAGDLLTLERTLVDPATGIVTALSEVPRDPSEPPLPLIYRAQLANHRFVGLDDNPGGVASGKGMSAEGAVSSALGEAMERYGAIPSDLARLRRASAVALDGAYLSPADLVGYLPDQYPRLPYAPWTPDTTMDWLAATRLSLPGGRVWVPALGTFLDYQVQRATEFFYPATSSGLAAGSTLRNAVLAGLLELLERDAFMLSWLGRRPGIRLDPASLHQPDVVGLSRSYARRDVELSLVLLPTDTPVRVCVAVGVDHRPGSDRPAAVVGLGADLRTGLAARKAALEVGQVRPALRARLRDPVVQARLRTLSEDPSQVRELDDHDLLYADPRHLGQLAMWLDAPFTEPGPDVAGTDANDLALLVDALASHDVPVCYVNLTPPDLASLGLHVVRVHAAGLQPIHFGAHEARLAGPRLRGLDLNLFPHPLA